MNPRLTVVTAGRVLRQVLRDRRTLALMLVVPVVLMCLLAWIYADGPLFERVGPTLLTVFPFVIMFVVTSVATLRERTSGTLERLLTTPMGKGDLVLGYALAFGLLAVVQGIVVTSISGWLLGLDTEASAVWLVLVVVASGVLGTSLGLLASAFAATEFQAVQLMPATVLPQFLLCGLLVPRDQLPRALELLSDVLPLSHVVDAATAVAQQVQPRGDLATPMLVIAGWIVVALVLGSLTLRRRTP
ncbi:antibiotic ABC transporter permease [Janibacter sp. Soil728]|uniref:ABC transporter permease n=1 Tax=Janibacter sp. Soil728 TaxID=1736393 RepID=UPI0006F295D2|nr:ABC transporter permease [Janibacter sp. Soil728]KRE37453.1 antibiotic ABC transporter permease [Janibacter sp. Soil728]